MFIKWKTYYDILFIEKTQVVGHTNFSHQTRKFIVYKLFELLNSVALALLTINRR